MIISCVVDRDSFPLMQCAIELDDNLMAASKLPVEIQLNEAFQQISTMVKEKLWEEETPWGV